MKLPNVIFVFLMLLTVGAFAQDYTTGNLVDDNNWSGATYATDPNDCCSNPAGASPIYDTATGVIKFSYGNSYVGQSIGLQNALGGTGIQVRGYNYSFDYRLIPRDNGTLSIDYLFAQIYVIDATGQAREITYHDFSDVVGTGTNDQWRFVSNTHTFGQPLLDPQSITIGFSGYDGGFWAGLYGPEVKNVSLSVNYGYNPCASDPLYSSSCPGYWEAFAQQLCVSGIAFLCASQSSVSVTEIEDPLPVQTTQTVQAVEQESSSGEVKVDAGGIEVSASGELSVPDGIPDEAKEKKEVDKNLIASIVREAIDNTETLRIVNQSIDDSLDENSNPSFATSVSLFGDMLNDPASELLFLRTNFSALRSDAQDQTFNDEELISLNKESNTLATENGQASTNVETTQEIQEEVAVNKNAENNEAAGGVDISTMSVTPAGFADYLNKNIIDARFYEQKEIYKNQQVVDNRRAERLLNLASDRLHQEMVNEQYKR